VKIEVVTTRTFDLSESNGKNEYARHLANSGIRNIAPGACFRTEGSPDDPNGPRQIPYATLYNVETGAVISEKSMLDPEIAGFLVIAGQMVEALARVWHSRVTDPNAPKPAPGTSTRGRKSKAWHEAKALALASGATEQEAIAAAQAGEQGEATEGEVASEQPTADEAKNSAQSIVEKAMAAAERKKAAAAGK